MELAILRRISAFFCTPLKSLQASHFWILFGLTMCIHMNSVAIYLVHEIKTENFQYIFSWKCTCAKREIFKTQKIHYTFRPYFITVFHKTPNNDSLWQCNKFMIVLRIIFIFFFVWKGKKKKKKNYTKF